MTLSAASRRPVSPQSTRGDRSLVVKSLLTRLGLILASVLCVMGVSEKFLASSRPTQPVVSRIYVVKPGDTLFAIADRFAENGSVSQYLFALEQDNGGRSQIYPGQHIVLPTR